MLEYQLALRDANLASIKADNAITAIYVNGNRGHIAMERHLERHPPLMQRRYDQQCHIDYREQQRIITDALHNAWLHQDDILRAEHQRLADIAGARRHHANIAQAAFRSIHDPFDMWSHPNA
jgi:hypothetical protein